MLPVVLTLQQNTWLPLGLQMWPQCTNQIFMTNYINLVCESKLKQEMRTDKTHIKIFHYKWICTTLNALKRTLFLKNAVCWVVTLYHLEEVCWPNDRGDKSLWNVSTLLDYSESQLRQQWSSQPLPWKSKTLF